MFGRLNGMVKDLKEHDSTLFQPKGITLTQREEFAHDFNVEQIKSIEAKLLKVKQDMETLEENKKSFHTIYKEHIGKRRGKKERKKTEGNEMKGRISGMKITSNLCMVSVLETR